MKLTTLLADLNFIKYKSAYELCELREQLRSFSCTGINCRNCPLDGNPEHASHILKAIRHETPDPPE